MRCKLEILRLIEIILLAVIAIGILLLLLRKGGVSKEELGSLKSELREEFSHSRIEISGSIKQAIDSQNKIFQGEALENERKLEAIRLTMESRLTALQADNNQKIEQMREVVDKRLQITLENRISDSFKLVSDRLEQVYRGLGEMQSLAVGVGDLKKIMSNVKTRGMLGELQLASILQEILSPEQYESNVATKRNSQNFVEFAVKLPSEDSFVYLPIDAKFPSDAYEKAARRV